MLSKAERFILCTHMEILDKFKLHRLSMLQPLKSSSVWKNLPFLLIILRAWFCWPYLFFRLAVWVIPNTKLASEYAKNTMTIRTFYLSWEDGRSFSYIVKASGPRNEPCGTLRGISCTWVLLTLLNSICCFLFVG